MNLSAIDKIRRARIKLLAEQPFFSYLAMHLRPKKTEQVDTMGVDQHGRLYYNAKFVETLNDSQAVSILCHEVMHVALKHLERLETRDELAWNIATDMVINRMLLRESFDSSVLKKGPRETDKMSSEELYEWLMNNQTQMKQSQQKGQSGSGDGNGKGSKGMQGDSHIYGSPEDEPGEAPDGSGQMPKVNWDRVMVEAAMFAKEQGNLPGCAEALIDGILLPSKIPWRDLLYRYITNLVPNGYTWAKRSKKSHAIGVYLPSTTKETVDITIALDTSGSVSNDEYKEFLSEILGISGAFKGNVRMTTMLCDATVHTALVDSTSIEDIMEHIRTRRGYGGTSFIPVFDWLKENQPECKLLIFFTDAYGSFPEYSQWPVIWVITESGDEDRVPPNLGHTIKMHH